LIVVHDRRATPFDGDLEDYARWLAGGPALAHGAIPSATITSAPAPTAAPAPSAAQRRELRRLEAEGRNRLAPLRAAIQKHEQQLAVMARERVELEARLATPELYRPEARPELRVALARQIELARHGDETEAAWLAASTELEAAEADGPA
jgi:ATP-binding cassette subfamily F protein 3